MNSYKIWFTLAEQYLRTSSQIMENIIGNNNTSILIDGQPIEIDRLFEETKWSDRNTLVPSVFLLLHGLELLLKGMIIWTGREPGKKHSGGDLIELLQSDKRITEEFLVVVSKYVGKEPQSNIVNEFLEENKNLSIKNIHIDMRYPEKRKEKTKFNSLRNREEEILEDLKETVKDMNSLYRITNKIIRKKES